MDTQHDRTGRSFDRRTVLLATAGLAGLAGCGGSSDTDPTEENETTAGGAPGDTPADDTPAGDTSASDTTTEDTSMDDTSEDTTTESAGPTECPMLPGSYTQFDPGSAPLPITFEHPSAMADTIGFLNPDNFEEGNVVEGRIPRGSEQEGDGDVRMAAGVDYFARYEDGRQNWYDDRSDLDTFATTTVNGESVEFLEGQTAGPYGGENNGYNAVGLVPFQSSDPDRTTYHRTVVSIEVLLYRTDASDVTETCGQNQRAALERTVQSIQGNGSSTFEQYIEY